MLLRLPLPVKKRPEHMMMSVPGNPSILLVPLLLKFTLYNCLQSRVFIPVNVQHVVLKLHLNPFSVSNGNHERL